MNKNFTYEVHDGPWPYATWMNLLTDDELAVIDEWVARSDLDQDGDRKNWKLLFADKTVFDLLTEKLEYLYEEVYPLIYARVEALGHIPCTTSDFDLAPMIECQSLAPGYQYSSRLSPIGVHRDAPWKAFTSVLYFSHEGAGTTLYTEREESSYVGSAVWKRNTGISFVATNRSWHSFGNPISNKTRRVTFNLVKGQKHRVDRVHHINDYE